MDVYCNTKRHSDHSEGCHRQRKVQKQGRTNEFNEVFLTFFNTFAYVVEVYVLLLIHF